MGQEVVERYRHAPCHPLLPQWLEPARRDLPGLMRLRHAGHEDRERRFVGRDVAPRIAAGDDLRALHAPPGHHHPRAGRLHHECLHLIAAGLRLGGEPSGRTPWLEYLEPQVHLPGRGGAGPCLAVVAVEPAGRCEEDAAGAGRQRREGCKREALALDGEAAAADAGDRRRLPRRPGIDLGGDCRQQGRAGPREPRAFAEPLQVVHQFERRAEHGLSGDEHVEVTRDGAKPGVGGADQRSASPLIAGSHAAAPLREGLNVVIGEPGAQIPHQHAVPVAEDGQRVGLADVNVGDRRRRADHPQPGFPRGDELLGRRGFGEPHAVEAERCQRLERLTVPVDRPRKERQAVHVEDAPRQSGGRIDRRGHRGGGRLNEWIGHRRRGGGNRWWWHQARHVKVVHRDLESAGSRWSIEHEVSGSGAFGATRAMFQPQGRQLPREHFGQLVDVEQLPAVDVAGGPAADEHLDGPARAL